MHISSQAFGTSRSGESVELYTLKNQNGLEVQIMTYGCIITKILCPDKNGQIEDVVLGFDTLEEYEKDSPFFGAAVGRYANRIAKGKFTLEGKEYQLVAQNKGNHLHGGLKGFDKVVWNVKDASSNDHEAKLVLTYLSKDGEEGYPGNLDVQLTYTLNSNNELDIRYEATTDQTTILNLTQHTYFNLTGNIKSGILDHDVQIHASRFVPVDETVIPTGELLAVKGNAFDFSQPKKIGLEIDANEDQIAKGGGYDHCYAFDKAPNAFELVASAHEPISGRRLEVRTTEPGMQFYTGNNLDGRLTGKMGVHYTRRIAFCFETQHFPDSPNQAHFPTTVLRSGEKFDSRTNYRFV
ncbi:MAG: aldose epimerase family protein [Aquirufa sp.]